MESFVCRIWCIWLRAKNDVVVSFNLEEENVNADAGTQP